MRSLSTVAPFGFDFDTERFLRTYGDFGCHAAQFYRNLSRPTSLDEAAALCEGAGCPIDSMHGVFGHDIDPSSPKPEERRHALDRFESEAAVARDLGIDIIVIHPAANFQPPEDQPFAFPKLSPEDAHSMESERWRFFDDFARRLADVAERESVVYAFENMGYIAPLGHNATALAEHVAAVGSDRITMCFDTGHAHFTGDMIAALRIAAPVVSYIHLHDNDRLVDDHRMPGDGTIDWPTFGREIDRLELDVPCMIEVFYPLDRVEQIDAARFSAFLRTACGLRARAA